MFCLAGLGKDAGATASTDWIAFSTKVTLLVDTSPAQAQDDTPNQGTLRLHSDTSSDDSETALNASTSSRWTGDYDTPPGDDQLSYPF